MKEKIQTRLNQLLIGLADLYINKEEIEKRIVAQKVAIQECQELLKEEPIC